MWTGVERPLRAAQANALALEHELAWFDQVLHARISLHFGQPCEHKRVHDIAPPSLRAGDSEYARLVRSCDFGFDERIVLVLALTPHVRPQLLDTLFVRNRNVERGYTEFGGWKGKAHGGFLPTCETAAFVVAGEDLSRRFELLQLFDESHTFRRRGILRVEHDAPGEPFLSGALLIESDYLDLLTTGERHKPDYSSAFPAKLVTTRLGWNDLVLGHEVMEEISAINTWIRHAGTILHEWRLATAIKPGYRSLFFGPPGTGKTLTATLIGQAAGADVYRIDLSMVVSKFIGETEKNLAHVFDQAQNRNWILFFDEADALFGKRTATSSSNDRYAN
ncbi:ATP-binding protein, partial [Piscinibacter sp.]|uniref:ATP-binding protein n=1 Tax=Piscinibacter sp. TaxID=1903157 RepID=UPI002C6FE031